MHVVLFREYGMSSCLGASLRTQNAEEDQPLTVITLAQRPVLRTWRLTPSGLVEIIEENRAQMGAFLDKPKTAKTNCSGQGNGLRYAMASMQGWRVDMEDAHVVEVRELLKFLFPYSYPQRWCSHCYGLS
ncbi:hypothetical protein ANCCAN_11588 [Ancylostoma caninum]|uniref:Uncharacterized protein n=1 Tax=Ancylostoma caninum TaxID=29170 RepID=A0A368GGQ5_ANCCA|nr:hypothetical protein ANCCAN_11588 [Ancylostoma caninum]